MAEVDPVHIDTRYPTKLEFLGSEVMNVHVGFKYDLRWRLTAENGSLLKDRMISVYYMNNTSPIPIWTDAEGVATWNWAPPDAGTFWFRAIFQEGFWNWYYRDSNEVRVVAVADVVPVSILFDVQPREFKPATQIMLSATVLHATSGQPLNGSWVSFYRVSQGGSKEFLGQSLTNNDGLAEYPYYYSSGPYAFLAETAMGQEIISSSGVMLTASFPTMLTLDVEREDSTYKHVISGSLEWDGSGVVGKQIRILVNDTVKAVLTTEPGGRFSTTLNLEPLNNKPTTYRIAASFEGDSPNNATAYALTPNGTRYAVCTTIHYGFKPASNSTLLTVKPRATTAVTTTKTTEQLQKEAKEAGWLQVWHEFTWWYPWYRLHTKININPAIDVGFNPILPGGETWKWEGLEIFAEVLEEVWQDIMLDVLGLLASYALAKTFSWNFPVWIAIELAKFAFQGVLLAVVWNNLGKVLAVSLANFVMGFISFSINVAEEFVKNLSFLAWGMTFSFLYASISEMISIVGPVKFRSWVDAVEIAFDFTMGVIALAHYLGII
jgi:5-hydroxyisourate hydrolase-like protein (transthyretin family)